MEHEAMVIVAEIILSALFPPAVHLQLCDVVQDNAVSTILRCVWLAPPPDHPNTIILKRPNRHEEAIFHEWAGLVFVGTRPALHGLVPQVYGYDEPTKLLVMEDLGPSDGQLLRQILMASETTRAVDALVAFQRAVGLLHAGTVGQYAAYARLRACYPNSMHSRHMIHYFAKIFDAFLTLPETLGRRTIPGFRQEVDAARGALAHPGPFFALTHGDTTPLNVFYTPAGDIRLYDFEACGFRHALLDGTYAHIRYLHSVWALDIPQPVQHAMYTAYRAALIPGCPAAADETVFQPAYLACCLAWLAGACWLIPQVYAADQRWGVSTWRQRIMSCLRQFIDLAQAWGRNGAVMETCQDIEQCLQAHWHETDNQLPLYPAFT